MSKKCYTIINAAIKLVLAAFQGRCIYLIHIKNQRTLQSKVLLFSLVEPGKWNFQKSAFPQARTKFTLFEVSTQSIKTLYAPLA